MNENDQNQVDDDDYEEDDDDIGNMMPDRSRLDKWLWAARFYKGRPLATQACEGGKVKVNGERAKPAKDIRFGDTLNISIGEYEWEVVVKGLNLSRGPAPTAQQLYEETEESQDRRALIIANRRALPMPVYEGKGRPTKRDRRDVGRMQQGSVQGGFLGPMDSTAFSPVAPVDLPGGGGGGGGGGRGDRQRQGQGQGQGGKRRGGGGGGGGSNQPQRQKGPRQGQPQRQGGGGGQPRPPRNPAPGQGNANTPALLQTGGAPDGEGQVAGATPAPGAPQQPGGGKRRGRRRGRGGGGGGQLGRGGAGGAPQGGTPGGGDGESGGSAGGNSAGGNSGGATGGNSVGNSSGGGQSD